MMKLVEDNHYHVWTDALHARALSHEAANKWDRGTYIRWTILTSWIALEMACQDALEDHNISYRFKENLDKAVRSKGLSPLDWEKGLWQKVLNIKERRINFVHRFDKEDDLFPDSKEADNAITVIREAINSIYKHAKKIAPKWTEDDEDPGWASKGGFQSFVGHTDTSGLEEGSPDRVKISYLYKDSEYLWTIIHKDDDYLAEIHELKKTIGKPISAIRIYKDDAIFEEPVSYPTGKIRGDV